MQQHKVQVYQKYSLHKIINNSYVKNVTINSLYHIVLQLKIITMNTQQKILPITLGDINIQNINILRKLNFQCFPVKYSTGLYIKIASLYTQFSKLAFYNDIVIGAYTVRIQDYKQQQHAYILTFGVLQPYRKYGIGKQMMSALQKDLTQNSKVKGIYLHMHVLNVVGLKFYESCGYSVDEKLQNYYTDLEEPHCLILIKRIQREEKKL